MNVSIHPVDLVVICVYMFGIIGVGLWSARRQSDTSGDYFLAGRSLRWPMIGLALFATNISTVHLVGLASAGYKDGLVFGNFEWLAAFCLVLLGLVFAPFYFRNRIATLPEYLERRFSPACRTFLAFMAIVGALFIHIGVSLYAGSAIFEQFFGIDMIYSIVLISVATAVYTVIGGLKAVVVTEAIQTFLLLIGATVVTVCGMLALADRGINTYAEFEAAVKPGQLSMLHAEGGFAWYAMLLGYPVLGIWYWCADQTIVQRVLGAQSERDAQLGPLFAGFIKILPVFLMVFPGVMAYVLFRDQIADNPDQALPVLIDQLIPSGMQGFGMKGLIVAGLLAALMSTIAGALNSVSTLVSIDIVQRIYPRTSEHRLVLIGRVTACIVMVLAMLWSTQGKYFGGIFAGLNQMIACLAPPITTVFLWGVFWRRGTRQAALATLVLGFLMGAVVFVLDFPAFGIELVTKVYGIPFMMQAWWLFCISSLIFVVTSLRTPPPTPAQVDGLCWENPIEVVFSGRIQGMTDPRLLAGALMVVMALLYWYFA